MKAYQDLNEKPEWSTYLLSLISEFFKRVVNINQKDNEILLD